MFILGHGVLCIRLFYNPVSHAEIIIRWVHDTIHNIGTASSALMPTSHSRGAQCSHKRGSGYRVMALLPFYTFDMEEISLHYKEDGILV
jgi:hypothetical protein